MGHSVGRLTPRTKSTGQPSGASIATFAGTGRSPSPVIAATRNPSSAPLHSRDTRGIPSRTRRCSSPATRGQLRASTHPSAPASPQPSSSSVSSPRVKPTRPPTARTGRVSVPATYGSGLLVRVVAHHQPLARRGEYDLGRDDEARQPDGVDLRPRRRSRPAPRPGPSATRSPGPGPALRTSPSCSANSRAVPARHVGLRRARVVDDLPGADVLRDTHAPPAEAAPRGWRSSRPRRRRRAGVPRGRRSPRSRPP